jgi:hypothetical protein
VTIYLELCCPTTTPPLNHPPRESSYPPYSNYPECRLSSCLHRAHLGCFVTGNGLYNSRPSNLQRPAMQTHYHSSAASAVPYVSQQNQRRSGGTLPPHSTKVTLFPPSQNSLQVKKTSQTPAETQSSQSYCADLSPSGNIWAVAVYVTRCGFL